MSLRKTFFLICLILSVICLAAGYWISGQRIGGMIAILLLPAGLFARKYPASGLPLICLLGSVGLAVAARLTGAPPLLMMFAAALALAVWDLLSLDSAVMHHSSTEQSRHYEKEHLQALGLALGLGLVGMWLGSFLRIQIPFLVVMLFITLTLFALDRVWGYIKNLRNV